MKIFESVVTETLEETDSPRFGEIKANWKYLNGETVTVGYYAKNGGEWISIQNQQETQKCFFVNKEAKVSTPNIEDLSQWNTIYGKVTNLIKKQGS